MRHSWEIPKALEPIKHLCARTAAAIAMANRKERMRLPVFPFKIAPGFAQIESSHATVVTATWIKKAVG
jgi:hypothetical protein